MLRRPRLFPWPHTHSHFTPSIVIVPLLPRRLPSSSRGLHPTQSLLDDSFPDHYATLGLSPTATASEIKKQFYALSKKHHPDVNPSPTASSTFVRLSTAYQTLGFPESRGRYDRDYQRLHASSSPPSNPSSPSGVPRGSYSSHQRPAGSRPASGLSRRRTQFRGPPPSFYRSGGWGEASVKRAKHAYNGQSEPRPQQEEDGPSPLHDAFPDSGRSRKWDPHPQDVDQDPAIPHWDRAGHRRTQDGLEGRARSQEQRKADIYKKRMEAQVDKRGVWGQFVMVSGMLAALVVPGMLVWVGAGGGGR